MIFIYFLASKRHKVFNSSVEIQHTRTFWCFQNELYIVNFCVLQAAWFSRKADRKSGWFVVKFYWYLNSSSRDKEMYSGKRFFFRKLLTRSIFKFAKVKVICGHILIMLLVNSCNSRSPCVDLLSMYFFFQLKTLYFSCVSSLDSKAVLII